MKISRNNLTSYKFDVKNLEALFKLNTKDIKGMNMDTEPASIYWARKKHEA